MAEIKIVAESRTAFGKGAARRIRRDAKVPAVLYGHGLDPLHVSLPGHELMLALKNSNALLSVELDGSSQLALPKQVQRDPIRGYIEHADLLLVRRGEKVTVNVPVVLSGEAESGALVVTETTEIALEAEATHIPEAVEISIEGLEIGTQILASDLQLPEGSTLQIDPDHLIVNVTAAPTAADVEAELAQAEADAGIERDEPEHLDEDAADEAIGTDGDAPAEDGAATDGQ
ncbi:MAG: 50S ribosomal protein L25/general stress protein Ctc [Nocardioidaceae bacterium]|nr:50S ribosomal protein L25/general stress protein Ctc [Nocardioidaceae bacterium]